MSTVRWLWILSIAQLVASGECDCDPPPIKNGSHYSIIGCDDCHHQGSLPEGTLVVNKCDAGFILSDFGDVSVCFKGSWRPGPPSCIKLCPPLVNPTRKIDCRLGDNPVPCTEMMRPRTKASVQCAEDYYPHFTGISFLKLECKDNGEWSSKVYDCRPSCGVHTPAHLTVNQTSVFENAPWHGSIYVSKDGVLTELCAGTLISENVMITAAHCVYDETAKVVRDKTALRVLLGNYVNNVNETDSFQSGFEVKRIVVNDVYNGSSGNYANDLALLDLKLITILGREVTPACVDWNDQEDGFTLGQPGTVPGWVRSKSDNEETFNITHLSYIDSNECLKQINESSTKLFTHDKFCAKDDEAWRNMKEGDPFWDQLVRYTYHLNPNIRMAKIWKNKTAKVRVLPGAGITFVKNKLHYLRGVRSIIEPTENGTFVFTSVIKNLDWFYMTRSSIKQFHEEKTYNINFKDCGRLNPKNNSNENHIDTPWSAIIFIESDYLCGGTIISPHIVITESQCVRDPANYDPTKPRLLKVAVGKQILSLSEHEPAEQILEVEQVIIRRRLQELNLFYEEDVAILELATNIKFTDQIRPVCIDWRNNFIDHNARSLKMSTQELTDLPKVLFKYKSIGLEWVPDETCYPMVADFERSRYTENIFCTVFDPNQCTVDVNISDPKRISSIGQGLTVEKNGRHYLYGLRHYQNLNPVSQWYSLYTNVTNHVPWLETHRLSLEYDRNFQNCGKANTKVGLISHGKNATQLDHPWHAGLFYDDKQGGFEQKCGGTLVHPKIVLTAAHCVYFNFAIINTKLLRVVVGKIHKNWNQVDPKEQRLEVASIVIPASYYGSKGTFRDDIALLNLTLPALITDHVLPARIPKSKDSIPAGTNGSVVGWGHTEHFESAKVLQLATVPTIPFEKCIKMSPESFKKFISRDKICTLYINETGPQEGDSGGGLTFEINGRHYVHGVVSVKPPQENKFGAFTNVIAHFEWIREKTSEIVVDL